MTEPEEATAWTRPELMTVLRSVLSDLDRAAWRLREVTNGPYQAPLSASVVALYLAAGTAERQIRNLRDRLQDCLTEVAAVADREEGGL